MVHLRENWHGVWEDARVAHRYSSATDVRTYQHIAWELVAAVGRIMAPKMSTSKSLEPENMLCYVAKRN